MPRKIRQLKADLRRAGFGMRPGKGDHTVWRHPLVPRVKVVLDGKDDADARHYQEEELADALGALREAERQAAEREAREKPR